MAACIASGSLASFSRLAEDGQDRRRLPVHRRRGRRAIFCFSVPGKEVRTIKDSDRAFAEIDGVLIQVVLVPAEEPESPSDLDAHASIEKRYLESLGAKVSSASSRSHMALRHHEWASEFAGRTTYYLTANAGRRILVVAVVAARKDIPSSSALETLGAVCSSLTTN